MFDSTFSLHMPGKVERFGKSYHGLVLMPAQKITGSSQVKITYNDITIITRDGKSLPYPLSKKQKDKTANTQALTASGPMCLYKHPLAVMEQEDVDGRDWSGYVIFDIRETYIPNIVGYRYGALFAFTQDANKQGLLIQGVDGSFKNARIAKPLKINSASLDHALVPIPVTATSMRFTHAAQDGRSIYLTRFPTPRDVNEDYNFPAYWDKVSPKMEAVALSGGLNIDGNLALQAAGITINQPPADETETDYRSIVLYSWIRVHVPFVGTCYNPPTDAVVSTTGETNYETPIPTESNYSTFLDEYSIDSRKTTIHSHIDSDGVASYVTYKISEESMAAGSGGVSGSGDFILGETPCGADDKGRTCISNTVITGYEYSSTGQKNTIIELSGFGATSTFLGRSDTTRSESGHRKTTTGEVPESSSSVEVTYTFTAELDGVVLFSSDEYIDSSGGAFWQLPSNPVISAQMKDGFSTSIALIEKNSLQDGTKWVSLSIGIADYQSNDLKAIFVTLRKGTLKLSADGTEWLADPATLTTELFIGKTFARGFVDSYTHQQMITGDTYLIRTYDPLEQKVSGVYSHPVAYQ